MKARLDPTRLVFIDETGTSEAIEAAGASLLYLPPYSPDLNPIEQAFAKLKASCEPPSRSAPFDLAIALTPFATLTSSARR